MQEVIAVFDAGKTQKKLILFGRRLEVIRTEESRFGEITDEDGDPCEDAAKLREWVREGLGKILSGGKFRLTGVNFTSYGASLVHMDREQRPVTPLYNYLKPLPDGIAEPLYASWGGEEEFCRRTASPPLGMLNSGLQLLWLRRYKPELAGKIVHTLHLPQYLSWQVTGKITSEHTSVGCHTALWDFDRMQYHPWAEAEGFSLPDPVAPASTFSVVRNGHSFQAGVGLHDSSASLAPFLDLNRDPFVLVSTGTWSIAMNPSNTGPLSMEELRNDCLCYLSVKGLPVKSSRFFLGRIHDLNVARISAHFGAERTAFRNLTATPDECRKVWRQEGKRTLFFRDGIPESLVDNSVELSGFGSFREAYMQLMLGLARRTAEQIRRILREPDPVRILYVTGGFARNPFFTGFMEAAFPGKRIRTPRMEHATALGAALPLARKVWPEDPVVEIRRFLSDE